MSDKEEKIKAEVLESNKKVEENNEVKVEKIDLEVKSVEQK